ncbi:MAG: GntR family transcriptional regulator [Clostridia bacterium]|nr:GntR family transcriptional regulator [Clostridia bacterium]
MAEQPKYLQVADILRKEIADGVFRDGQTLMTEEELRFRFDVSRQTIRQAIALLEEDGLVDRRRGSGTYVRHGPRRRQGTIHVGVVTTYITDYIFPSIVSGIESVLNENGVVMNLSATYNDSRTERNILERMMDGQVDGLIVEGARTAKQPENEDLFRRLAQRNIPVLFMNTYYPELVNVPHVVMDDYGGGRIAAREVLSRGYRKPGGMFKVDDLQGKERLKGFLDEMRDEGVIIPDERLLLFGTEQRMNWQNTPEGKAFVDRLVRREADCMTCYNDVFASSLMSILQGRGMKLPEDMGFIGFDNAVYAEMTNPKLTTLGHPKEAFGALVAEKLLRMISGEKERSVNMAWTLIERESLPRVDKL